MKSLSRILIAALLICISLVPILASMNLICRAPDLYKYELISTGVLKENNVGINEIEMSSFFSEFMMGKVDHFSYSFEEDGREVDLFTISEGLLMEKIRGHLNNSLIIMFAAILLIVASCWVLIRYDLREIVRTVYKWSWVFFLVAWCGFILVLILPVFNETLFYWYSTVFLGEDSLLLKLITPPFIKNWVLAVLGVSIIFMAIEGSILWKISKPRRIFW